MARALHPPNYTVLYILGDWHNVCSTNIIRLDKLACRSFAGTRTSSTSNTNDHFPGQTIMANLLALPPELVVQVITESLPEGFESLALSCKAIHQLCKPFIEHHSALRAQFHRFTYDPLPRDAGDPLWRPIWRAYTLLERIALEPIVARYIQHADLTYDGFCGAPTVPPDLDHDGPIVAMFADSPYLRDAGLDWKQYHALIAADRARATDFRELSQHAAAFVLTLLPNLKSLKLPMLWNLTDSSYKLIKTVVAKARQSMTKQQQQQQHGSSLAQVVRLETLLSYDQRAGCRKVLPFLALPKLRSYTGRYGHNFFPWRFPLWRKARGRGGE